MNTEYTMHMQVKILKLSRCSYIERYLGCAETSMLVMKSWHKIITKVDNWCT